MKRSLLLLISIAILTLGIVASSAEMAEDTFLGTMRVINCEEWVSLRAEPDTKSERLAEIPLGTNIENCYRYNSEFVSCEYDGCYGYVLTKYLQQASSFGTGMTVNEAVKMTETEILSYGSVILDTQMDAVRILATVDSAGEGSQLRLGVFVDSEPVWGYLSTVAEAGQTSGINAFIGGTSDDPKILIYNIGTGLTMLELWNGEEKWTITPEQCPFGAGNAAAVSDSGIMYIGGWDGPNPIAVSANGEILWKSEIPDEDVYGLYRIDLNMDEIDAYYESGNGVGKLAMLEYTGELISVSDISMTEE